MPLLHLVPGQREQKVPDFQKSMPSWRRSKQTRRQQGKARLPSAPGTGAASLPRTCHRELRKRWVIGLEEVLGFGAGFRGWVVPLSLCSPHKGCFAPWITAYWGR